MLHIEKNREYIVFPSWIEGQVPCKWEDLPGILEHPERFEYLGIHVRQWLREDPESFTRLLKTPLAFPGAFGWGIIRVDMLLTGNSLTGFALSSMGQRCGVIGMPIPNFDVRVSYLEPLSDVARGYPLLGWGKRPRKYVCRASVEHAEAAGEDVYLLVVAEREVSTLRGFDQMVASFRHYGFKLSDCAEVDQRLLALGAKWYPPEYSRGWFRIGGGEDGHRLAFRGNDLFGIPLEAVGWRQALWHAHRRAGRGSAKVPLC